MKMKKYFLTGVLGIMIMLPNFVYSQFGEIDINAIKEKADKMAKEYERNHSSPDRTSSNNSSKSGGSSSNSGSNSSNQGSSGYSNSSYWSSLNSAVQTASATVASYEREINNLVVEEKRNNSDIEIARINAKNDTYVRKDRFADLEKEKVSQLMSVTKRPQISNTIPASYTSKGTYHGVLQDLAQSIGKNISDYFSKDDWEYCQNSKNFFTPRCKKFQKDYNRFWRDVINKEPMYEIYQKLERELVDMGIDIANIWVTAGVTIAFTPAGKVVVAGPQEAVFTLLKELNQGKSIKDPEVLVKVAAAFSSSEISAGIDTGSPLRDAAGKAVVTTSFTIIKGEDNNSEILKKGTEVFLIKSIQNPVIEGILKTAFGIEKKVKNTTNNN